jgi:hypothetical protein
MIKHEDPQARGIQNTKIIRIEAMMQSFKSKQIICLQITVKNKWSRQKVPAHRNRKWTKAIIVFEAANSFNDSAKITCAAVSVVYYSIVSILQWKCGTHFQASVMGHSDPATELYTNERKQRNIYIT